MLATLVSLALLTVAATVAHGQDDLESPLTDPGEKLSDATDQDMDTYLTPRAKNANGWEQLGGARFGSERLVRDSPTPADVDFYGLGFRHAKHAFFVGAQCRRDDPDLPLDFEQAAQCPERVPVIYEFTNRDDEGALVREAWAPSDDSVDRGGYVGAVTWLGGGRALAVGGDGEYIRREKAPVTPDNDPAGMARVWMYDDPDGDGRFAWRELRQLPDGTDGDELPDGMRGMQAVGSAGAIAKSLPLKAGVADGISVSDYAEAGGFRQRWRFDGQGFELIDTPAGRIRSVVVFLDREVDRGPLSWRPEVAFGMTDAPTDPANTAGWESDFGLSHYSQIVGEALASTALHPGGPVMSAIGPDGPRRGNEQSPTVGGAHGATGGDLYVRGVGVRKPGALATRFHLSSVISGGASRGEVWAAVGSFPSGQAALLLPRPATRTTEDCVGSTGVPDANCQHIHSPPPPEYVVERDVRSRLYKLQSHALNGLATAPSSGTTWAVGDHGALLRTGDGTALVTDEPAPPSLRPRVSARLADDAAYEAFRPGVAGSADELPSLEDQPLERFAEPRFVPAAAPDLGEPPTAIVMSRDGRRGWAFTASGTLYRYDGAFWSTCDPDGDPRFALPPDPECAGARPKVPRGHAVRIPVENDDDPGNDDRFELITEGGYTDPGGGTVTYAKGWHFDGARWRQNGSGDAAENAAEDDPRADFPRTGPGVPPEVATLAFASPNDGWMALGVPDTFPGRREQQVLNLWRFDGTRWVECHQGLPIGTTNPPGYKGDGASSVKEKCFDPEGRLPMRSVESWAANAQGMRLVATGTRVYLYGTRAPEDAAGQPDPSGRRAPLILYRDTAEKCDYAPGGDRRGCWRADGGGYDPGFSPDGVWPDAAVPPERRGRVRSLAVSRAPDLSYAAWVGGEFPDFRRPLAHLTTAGEFQLHRIAEGSPAADYGFDTDIRRFISAREGGRELAVALTQKVSRAPTRYPLAFNAARGRWDLLRAPFQRLRGDDLNSSHVPGVDWGVVSSDRRGGFWLAKASGAPDFHHYTDEMPRPVFTDVAHPIRERITDIAGGADGTVLVATERNVIYRYDRVGGFERIVLRDWEPSRVTTVGSPVTAVAVGPGGDGVAVGPAGRIASVTSQGVRLDEAAGTLCGQVPTPPCGTSRDLVSAAVAPGGAQLVAGKSSALLWKPQGEAFRRPQRPPVQGTATFTATAYPQPDVAYLGTDLGHIVRGELDGETWRWRVENLIGSTSGDLELATRLPITSLAIRADGTGYATAVRTIPGSGGGTTTELYERVPDSGSPSMRWRRVLSGYKLHTAAAAPGDGRAAAFGGTSGLVVTRREGRLSIARLPDGAKGATKVVLLPGFEDGQLEAWAATADRLLHYSSDPEESLLSPQKPARALADSPAPREGETVFAAFGKSECSYNTGSIACFELAATNNVTGRIVEELLERSTRPNPPQFVLFTGDVNDAANTNASQRNSNVGVVGASAPPTDSSRNHRRWRELVADYLHDRGIPVFAALGGQDLSATERCESPTNTACQGSRSIADNPGLNFAWRRAFATAPAPWGSEQPARTEQLEFRPVADSAVVEAMEQVKPPPPEDESDSAPGGRTLADELPRDVSNVTGDPAPLVEDAYDPVRESAAGWLRSARAPDRRSAWEILATRTHYAFDVVEKSSGGERRLARVVVVDSSLRSLTAADPVQNPVEAQGGQLGWLEEVLCLEGERAGCTRQPGQAAVVLSNSPTYSYGPGHGVSDPSEFRGEFRTFSPTAIVDPPDTQLDPTAFEAVLMKNRASVVVSGRIGWNGLYYATAPGVHEPCPGGSYPTEVPEPGARLCGRGESELPDTSQQTRQLAETLHGLGAPGPPPQAREIVDDGLARVLPFVVSSSAGGKLADPGETGAARDGFWRGYAIVRVDPSGDPRKTIVEQRPILDWVSLTAAEHTLRPGQRMTLRGIGREPYAGGPNNIAGRNDPPAGFRYIEIDSSAVTHRYDLVLADPEQPWLPLEDANGDYVPVPADVATVNDQTGRLRTGKGRRERTFALGMLSVGDSQATWPIVFEPRRSFAPIRPRFQLPAGPRAARAPAAQPPLRVSDAFAPPPAAPPATPSSPLSSQTLQAPQPPQLPSLPPVAAGAAPPPPQIEPAPPPPAPPPPPTVPAQQQPQPLALGAKVQAISIVPTVNPPAPPPVNPAPPAGSAARKEAKQRQAATAKSEEGARQQGAESFDVGEGPANMSPDGSAATRRKQDRPAASFSPVAHREQPSAWARAALYGGGLGLAGVTLALGFGVLRPRPRRRPPELPAPAHCNALRRRV